MDVGAYAAKRAAALAKSRELKVAVELGQRKTEAAKRRGVSEEDAQKAVQAEQARAAWLAKKKRQDRLKRQAEAEKQQVKQREEQDWQRQREERAAATGRRTGRPHSRGSEGRMTPPARTMSASMEGDEVCSTQSLPVLVPPSGSGTSAVAAPRELLRQRRQRRQSQSDVGARSSSDGLGRSGRGTGATGTGRGKVGRGGKSGRGNAGGSGRKPRPESASVRQRKTAASAMEVEAATERIKAAEAQEASLQELLAFALSDVEGIEEFEKQAETRPRSPAKVGSAQEVAQDGAYRTEEAA